MNQHSVPPAFQRTSGRGRICTKSGGSRSRIDRLYQEGAARIRVPDRPGKTDLETIIINTAGGVTGGDDLAWEAEAGPRTSLTVTTQACEKVYKADQSTAEVSVSLKVGEDATLNWLPQETIFFDRARLARTIQADMKPGSSLLLVEPVIFGRRAMNETFQTGMWRDTWRIHHKGTLIHAENVRLTAKGETGTAENLDSFTCLGEHTALATLLLVGDHAEGKLDGVRQILDRTPGALGGASCWNVAETAKLVVRLTALDGYTLRQALVPLINHLASGENAPASVPKIWSL